MEMKLNSKSRSPVIALAAIFMAFGAKIHAAEIAYLGLDDGIWQIWVINADGSDQRRLTDSPSDKVRASWYPDGRRLFVNAIDGFVYTVELDSGKAKRIPTALSGFQDAVLAPDGERFAFSLSTSGSVDDNNIWLASANGDGRQGNDQQADNLQKLTGMPRLQHEPIWSPDGTAIYFLSGDGGQAHNIWRIGLTERRPEQITANQLYHFDVAVSSDGTLAYSNNRDGAYDLWLRGPDGTERRLTDDMALDARPSWSPDGRRLVFESSRDGGPDLWLVDIESGALTRLTHTGGGARYPVWRWQEDRP